MIANDPPATELSHTRELHPAAIFLLILAGTVAAHWPLVHLPYIWDEAGYYVPAARDIWLNGSFIPLSTISNAHPPLVMMWVAGWWKTMGYAPLVTRLAMLVIGSFTLFSVYRLARSVASAQVAIASTICTGCYAVFFMQSSLVHLDMAAAGLTLFGVRSYIRDRATSSCSWFALAALAKETAILAPLTLILWDVLWPRLKWSNTYPLSFSEERWKVRTALLVSVVPLTLWFAYHYVRTGYVFGNPEFFRYNVAATLHPVRILLATGMRVWQVIGYMHLYFLSVATILAMFLTARKDDSGERPRINIAVQLTFLALIVAYVAAMSVVGGAVLARYMLPVIPLGIILCISTLWRRVLYWHWVILIVVSAFVVGWFVNPPYGFSFEDNLAYRDYIILHMEADSYLANKPGRGTVLTAWPASDEVTRPYLGYVDRPMRVVRIEDFSSMQLQQATESGVSFDTALIFSTKYFPPNSLLARWPAWERLQTRFFGFHRDLSPEVTANLLSGRVIYEKERKGQWISVIEINRAIDAHLIPAALANKPTVSTGGSHFQPLNSDISLQHEMAGVCLHDQPYFSARLQAK